MVNLGLIGAGRWGRCYIKTIKAMPGTRLAKLASSNPESAAMVPPSCIVTSNWQDVAEDGTLDGIIVSTPPAFHASMAERAIRAGIPVLIEKPMTLSIEEADRLAVLAESEGVLVMIGHTHLFSSAFRKLKELGMGLGPLRRIRSHAGNWGPWRPDTPMLWDWAPHDLAMCLSLVGTQPLLMNARLDAKDELPDGTGEAVRFVMNFPGNVPADIRVSNIDMQKSRYFEAEYDGGTLVYDDTRSDKLTYRKFPDEEAISVQIDGVMPLNNLLDEFCDFIRTGKRRHESLGIGVKVIELLALGQQLLDSSDKEQASVPRKPE